MISFSVIIPFYNRRDVLLRAAESVMAQSYKNFELILVDDGSTDGGGELVKSWAREQAHSNIQILSQENKGVSSARNLGRKYASSEWLAFLDSDDQWFPQKLKTLAELIEQSPEIPLWHSEEIWVRNGVRVNPKKKHKKSGGDIFKRSLELCLIGPSASVIKTDVLDALGGWREDFPVCEDYDLWLKLTSTYEVGFCEEPLITKYGGHEDQLSHKHKAMDYWRVLSMLSLLEDKKLDTSQERALREVCLKKIEILIKGHIKHEKSEKVAELMALKASL